MEPIGLSGGGGTIGRHFPATDIRLVSRLESSDVDKISELDSLVQSPQVFIHLAGLVSTQACAEDKERARKINIEGALSWWRALEQKGCSKFIFVSSSHVYAPVKWGEKIDVNHPLGPSSFYGELKREAEEKLQRLAQSSAMKLVIVRVFSVLSEDPPSWSLSAGLKRRALAGDLSVPCLECVRDFLWDYQVAGQLRQLAEMEVSQTILNLCSGQPTTLKEVAAKVYLQQGLSPEKLFDPTGQEPTWVLGQPSF